MIEYLRIEIAPNHYAGTDMKELRIRVKSNGKDFFEKRQLCEPDELISFFDQIWDCGKAEVLKALKEAKPRRINNALEGERRKA